MRRGRSCATGKKGDSLLSFWCWKLQEQQGQPRQKKVDCPLFSDRACRRRLKGGKTDRQKRVKATEPAKYRIQIGGFSHQSKKRWEGCGELCENSVVAPVEMCVRMVFPETPKCAQYLGITIEFLFPLAPPKRLTILDFGPKGWTRKASP